MRRLVYSLPVLSLLVVPACETSGDRSRTGECPQGEVCSAKTPNGLHFRGPDFADDWFADPSVKRIAVGGTERITVINATDEQSLAFPFSATLDNSKLTADAPEGAFLTLHAAQSGTAMLRIKDASDGKLFDRVTVEGAPVVSTDVIPFHDEWLLATDGPPAMLLGGADIRLMARLWDASGIHRLIDQSLTITVTGAASEVLTWDTVHVTPTQVGRIGVSLHAAGIDRGTGMVTVVDSIDGVVPGVTSFDANNPPRAKQSLTACVEARNGVQPVVGLTWAMSAEGADTTANFVATNCLTFVRNTPGTVTIHGSALGKSADLVVTVQPAMQARYVALPDVTSGEIAASLESGAL
jgi:hypothetical protein